MDQSRPTSEQVEELFDRFSLEYSQEAFLHFDEGYTYGFEIRSKRPTADAGPKLSERELRDMLMTYSQFRERGTEPKMTFAKVVGVWCGVKLTTQDEFQEVLRDLADG